MSYWRVCSIIRMTQFLKPNTCRETRNDWIELMMAPNRSHHLTKRSGRVYLLQLSEAYATDDTARFTSR